MRRSRAREDEGTILFLTIGLSVVLMLLVAVVVDVSAVILAKRGVSSAADGAALASAQQQDHVRIESEDDALATHLPLDSGLVSDIVTSYQSDAGHDLPGLRLVARVEGTDEAVIDAYRTITLPFGGWLGVGKVQVHAVARARSPVAN
jgi:Flp pilus assembly protein TadG